MLTYGESDLCWLMCIMTHPTQSDHQGIAMQRAREAGGANRFHEAIALCTRGLQVSGDDAFASHRLYNNRGIAHRGLGQSIPAIADFSMAIRLCPSSWLPAHNRASVYSDIGAFNEAVQVRCPTHFCQTG